MGRKHNRKIGICAADLVKVRFKFRELAVLQEIQDELERLMVASRYLDDAPFDWVTVSVRFGLKNEDKPHYEKINKKYGDLPLAIEIDVSELVPMDRASFRRACTIAVLKALVHAGQRYGLAVDRLSGRLADLGRNE